MDRGSIIGRRCSSARMRAEDHALGQIAREAEARLAARRQARAQAREKQMRELERQQKQLEQNADRLFDMHSIAYIDPLSRSRLVAGFAGSPVIRAHSMSSRRSSEDSVDEEARTVRDMRCDTKEIEERFRKLMFANAQLDNENASQAYQIQLLKDKLEEVSEFGAQLQREFGSKSRDYNALRRDMDKITEELEVVRGQLDELNVLIAKQGLRIVSVAQNADGTEIRRTLVTMDGADILDAADGSLDMQLNKLNVMKRNLVSDIQGLKRQVDSYKASSKGGRGHAKVSNGPAAIDDECDAQREMGKVIADYKYKLQKAEQEIASLQSNLARSETQVIRYRSTAEAAEKAESELKIERRKLQRENREAMVRMEEIETSNHHLLKRLDKLKNAKSALFKEL